MGIRTEGRGRGGQGGMEWRGTERCQQMPVFQAWCRSCQHRWCPRRECSYTARWPTEDCMIPGHQGSLLWVPGGTGSCSWAPQTGWLLYLKYVLWQSLQRSLRRRPRVWRNMVKKGKQGERMRDGKTIILRLSRAMLTEHPVRQERWWSRSRQMDGDGSFQAPPFHAGGPGCRDCQCMVNYLNGERGKGNGCICRTSF